MNILKRYFDSIYGLNEAIKFGKINIDNIISIQQLYKHDGTSSGELIVFYKENKE